MPRRKPKPCDLSTVQRRDKPLLWESDAGRLKRVQEKLCFSTPGVRLSAFRIVLAGFCFSESEACSQANFHWPPPPPPSSSPQLSAPPSAASCFTAPGLHRQDMNVNEPPWSELYFIDFDDLRLFIACVLYAPANTVASYRSLSLSDATLVTSWAKRLVSTAASALEMSLKLREWGEEFFTRGDLE